MSRLLGTFNPKMRTVMSSWNEAPRLVKAVLGVNAGFFGLYTLSSGSGKMWLKRNFTMQPSSPHYTMFTSHFCPTTLFQFLFTSVAISKVWLSHSHFHITLGFGVVALGLANAISLKRDASFTHSGGVGLSSMLLAYSVMKNPNHFRHFKRSNPFVLFTLITAFHLIYFSTSHPGSREGFNPALTAALLSALM